MLIQSSVNSFGSIAMAGNTASANVEGFVYTAMNAVYQTNLSFTSQNLGGGKYTRINRTLYICLAVVTVVGLVLGTGAVLGGTCLLYTSQYRNVLRGNWEQSTGGFRYKYEKAYLKSWVLINSNWYLFGDDGYMKKGWQEYKGEWYYLDRDSGQMRTNCTIDGHEIDGSGMRIS